MSKSELRRLSSHGITKEDKDLMDEIRQNPEVYQRLKDKAKWEHMTLFAILREWGDPREWK